MVALTSAPFVALFACSWIFVLCQETQELKVKPGEDVTLPCRSHRGATIRLIKWIRPDVKPDDYVFFFRDGRSNENYQHESYRGRVELRDPEMKDGDASVILKNVNINDAGTYECRVREENASELTGIVRLTVTGQRVELRVSRCLSGQRVELRVSLCLSGHTAGHKEGGDKEGGDKEGNVGLMVGLPVCVILLLLGVGGFVIFKNITDPQGINNQLYRYELQNLQRD